MFDEFKALSARGDEKQKAKVGLENVDFELFKIDLIVFAHKYRIIYGARLY